MEQYPIPQFIEEEGKIISFLTFRQFFWLVGGGGVVILFYYTLPFAFFAICSLIVGALVGAIAFVKIDNASLVKIFMNFIGFSFGAKTYTWKRKENLHPFAAPKQAQAPGPTEQVEAPRVQQSKLQSVRTMIDTKR